MSEKRLMLWALVVLLLGSAAVLCQPEPRRGMCGHRTEAWWRRLPPFYERHCSCPAFRLVNELPLLEIGQRLYESEYGTMATNLETLVTAESIPVRFPARLVMEGTNWSCVVPKHPDLPGHYLLQNRTIYFCENRPATTNDVVLRRW